MKMTKVKRKTYFVLSYFVFLLTYKLRFSAYVDGKHKIKTTLPKCPNGSHHILRMHVDNEPRLLLARRGRLVDVPRHCRAPSEGVSKRLVGQALPPRRLAAQTQVQRLDTRLDTRVALGVPAGLTQNSSTMCCWSITRASFAFVVRRRG